MISVKIGGKYIEASIRDASIEDILKLLVANCKIDSISMGDSTEFDEGVSDNEEILSQPESYDSDTMITFHSYMKERESELLLKTGMSWDIAVFDYVVTHPREEYTPLIHKALKNVRTSTKSPDIIASSSLRRLADKGILVKVKRGVFRLNPELVELAV